MDKIKLIVGLGNPGKEYENTRHNLGFLFVDALVKHLNAPNFEFNKKLNSEISEVRLRIAKPQTFMNKSGQTVLALIKQFKIKPENILIVHDDIDILWGNFKLSFGRSSAGHKGVDSIIKSLKTKNFWRLRIGIQPTLKKHVRAEKIILKKITPTELKTLNATIKKAIPTSVETALT
ncbi:MAG: aminoacyl-tRNA hydrolase [bacterium]|nr:aminoacyl-tRNA hydrolase [bacterium]